MTDAPELIFVGIDASKDTLEVALDDRANTCTLGNDEARFKKLLAMLGAVCERVARVLLEATAGSVSVGLVKGLKHSMPGLLMAGLSVTLTGDAFQQLGDAGNGLAMSIVVPNPFRPNSAVVRDYQAAVRAVSPDAIFSLVSLEAYINLRVLAEGLERAGPGPSQAKLRSALASIRNWDLGGFTVHYSGQSPHVGSRYIGLGILNGAGRIAT